MRRLVAFIACNRLRRRDQEPVNRNETRSSWVYCSGICTAPGFLDTALAVPGGYPHSDPPRSRPTKRLSARAGRPNEARQTLEELIETTGRVGIRFLNGIGERLLGEIATASPEEAASHFQRSIAILSDIGATNELAHALRGYGRVLRAQGRVADAREHLTRALESFERLGTPNEPDLLRTELDSLGSGYGSHASGAAAAPGGREPGRDRPGFRPDNERSR